LRGEARASRGAAAAAQGRPCGAAGARASPTTAASGPTAASDRAARARAFATTAAGDRTARARARATTAPDCAVTTGCASGADFPRLSGIGGRSARAVIASAARHSAIVARAGHARRTGRALARGACTRIATVLA